MIKNISILGSTGSIGRNVFKIIDSNKKSFKINLLSANKNYSLICNQIKKYKPKFFIINNLNVYKRVKYKFKNHRVEIFKSFNYKNKNFKSDITISAIPGLAGLEPTIEMIKLSSKVLIANKESVICGWNLIEKTAKRNNTIIIPVDSEHFSILELIKNHKIDEIKKVYLTASGGPFLNYKYNKLKQVKPKEALNHPKWRMGKKITVDSSTLMNKILELIEAEKLFKIPNNKLGILIHPDSLIHAVIQFKNGLSKMLFHDTSMVIPLANAIFDNDIDINIFYKKKKKDFTDLNNKPIFKKLDQKIFPIIKIKNRITEHPSTPIIINAANEVLVEHFLKKNIPFLDISKFIMTIMRDRKYKKYAIRIPLNLREIFQIDKWARDKIREIIKKRNG